MSTMPTQRPFLGNFLAAFRAHSQTTLHKSPPPISSTAATAGASATLWTSASQTTSHRPSPSEPTTASSPKPINPKQTTSAAAAAAPQERQLIPLEHTVSPRTHLPRSPPSPGIPIHGPQNKPQPTYPTVQDVRRSRRGSDSSSSDSGNFREVRAPGGEKWFIGGLTATGEEKYYKLSMVKREKSVDRISTDQMSL